MSDRLKNDIKEIFGAGGQAALARFMILAGDERSEESIIRTLGNWTNGRHRVSGELITLLAVLKHPDRIRDMVAQAKRDLPPPMFRLKPKPEVSAAPMKRK